MKKTKSLLKRMLQVGLAGVLLLSSVQLNVFAEGDSYVPLEVKRNGTITFEEIVENAGTPDKVEVTKSYTVTWGGSSKVVDVVITDDLYHFKVGETTYNSKDHSNAAIPFTNSGEFTIYTGSADYSLTLLESGNWSLEHKDLVDELDALKVTMDTAQEALNAANSAVTNAKSAVTAKELELVLPKAAVTNAQNDYNDAETAVKEKKEELGDIEGTYATKIAELQTEKDKLDGYQKDLDAAEAKIPDLENAVDNAQNKYNNATGFWDKAAAKTELETAKLALSAAQSAVTSAQSILNDQKISVETKEKELKESGLEGLKAQLEEELETAEETLKEKETALNEANEKVAGLEAELAELKQAVTDAENDVTTKTDAYDTAKDAYDAKNAEIATHAEELTAADFVVSYVAGSYVSTNGKATNSKFTVNVYDVLTVTVDEDTMSFEPTISVENANGTVSEDNYKVYEGNKAVVVSMPKYENYTTKLWVDGDEVGIKENDSTYTYAFDEGISKDTTIEVEYTELGKKPVYYEVTTGIESITVMNGNVEVKDGDKVYVGNTLEVFIDVKDRYLLDSVVVNDKEGNAVFVPTKLDKFDFTVETEDTEYYINAVAKYTCSTLALVEDGHATATGHDFTSEIEAGETVNVSVHADENYSVDTIKVLDNEGKEVDETIAVIDGTSVAFTAPTPYGSTYKLVVTTTDEHNTVTYVNDDAVTSIVLKDKATGATYNFGEKSIPVGTTLVLEIVLDEAYGFTGTGVAVVNENGEVAVSGENGTYEFTTSAHSIYEVSVLTENTQSTLSIPTTLEGASVSVSVAGKKVNADEKGLISAINNGSEVVITITPEENYYVSEETALLKGEAVVVDVNDVESLGVVKKANGVWTITFTANKNAYVLNAVIKNPIVAPNSDDVSVNKYDMISKDYDSVNNTLGTGFEMANGVEGVTYEYLAGEITGDDIEVLGKTLTEHGLTFNIPVWLEIKDGDVTFENVSTLIANELKELVKNVPWVGGILANAITPKFVDKQLSGLTDNFHDFGDLEEEVVRVKVASSDNYGEVTSESRIVKIEDLRTEVDVDVHSTLSVTYGSYTSNADLLEKLLDGKLGVTVNGEALADGAYNDLLTISKDMAKADVGTYEVVVKMSDADYEYKDSENHTTVEITVTKANATIDMTTNNVVKYENVSTIKDNLYTITPDVVIEDTVDHIPFVVGLNAIDGKFEAVVDIANLYPTDLVSAVTMEALKAYVGTGKEYSISEFMDVMKEIIGILGNDGSTPEISDDIITQITDMITEATQSVDVTIKLTADGKSFVPSNHGIYLVGVVSTDGNYNTTANATYLVITTDFVTVQFVDENGNPNADRQFTYNGEPHAMTAIALDEDGKVVEGTMKYYYTGVQSDGSAYASTEAPVHTGTYAVTAMFNDQDFTKDGKPENVGIGFGAMVIWPSGEAYVSVTDKKVVVFDENDIKPVEIADMIQVTPEDTDAKVAVITVGIDVATDFSEEGLEALEGVVNIDFPERVDTVLKGILPSGYTETGVSLEDLRGMVNTIQEALATIGMDASAMNEVLSALSELPESTKLTFFNTYNGEIDTNALPSKIGAYLVVGVIFDPDYIPEVGAGTLFIVPEMVEEKLAWTYDDLNGVITQPVLDIVDLSAYATIDDANTAKIEYVFVALTKDGTIDVVTADASNIEEVSKGLRNGVYTQMAYIWEGVDAKMVIAEPIVREFVHVPQQVVINFNADGMDADPENVRRFTYDGTPKAMPYEVVKLDYTEVDEECISVHYEGVDNAGNKYSSSDAPTNAGVYTVTVTYKEYDTVPSESLKYAGINVGVLVIDPTENTVKVNIEDIICDCGCNRVTCGTTCECSTEVDLAAGITNKGEYLITIITDENGNVYVNVPEVLGVQSTVIENELYETVNDLLNKVNELESALGITPVSDVVDTLIAELKGIDTDVLTNTAQTAIEEIIAQLESATTPMNEALLAEIIAEIKDLDLTSAQAVLNSEIANVISKLESIESELGDSHVNKTMNLLKSALGSLDVIQSLTINGEVDYSCGEYTVTAIGFGTNYTPTMDTDTFVIKAPIVYHTITWLNYDGSVLKTEEVEYGSIPQYIGAYPTRLPDAQYTYAFKGWDAELAAVTEDVTFTAEYDATLRSYTVTWVDEDGTVLETDEEVLYGTVPTYDGETPTKAADDKYTYTFAGWTTEVVMVSGDATYTAKYTATPLKVEENKGPGTSDSSNVLAWLCVTLVSAIFLVLTLSKRLYNRTK